MTTFYFVRHGLMDDKEMNTKIYQGLGINALTLSNEGIEQIKKTALDERLKGADIIITSPYGRALHSAAILSKELNIDLKIETNLHEWVSDRDYKYLPFEEEMKSLQEFIEKSGKRDGTCKYNWEDLEGLCKRVSSVIEKYKGLDKVIVVTHGLVMNCFLGVGDLDNGQIEEFVMK